MYSRILKVLYQRLIQPIIQLSGQWQRSAVLQRYFRSRNPFHETKIDDIRAMDPIEALVQLLCQLA